jgi:hypothetical protein
MADWQDDLNPDKAQPRVSTNYQRPQFSKVGGLDYRLRRLEMGAPRLRAGQQQPTTGQYSRIPRDILLKGETLATTHTGVQKKGGVIVSANKTGFAYTSTAASITWYWDGTHGSNVLVLHRADKSQIVVPTTGSGLQVTGLANLTTYYFLPFWSPNNLCNVGWVQGTVGTPQIAFVVGDTTSVNNGFYLLQQTLQDREPLTGGFMTAQTGSSGSGGGGGGFCVMSGTDIVPCGGGDYTIQVHGEREWVRVQVKDGRHLFCTNNHPLYREDVGRVPADSLEPGMPLMMDDGIREISHVHWLSKSCSKWSIHMPDGHLFYANGFISHNLKPIGG